MRWPLALACIGIGIAAGIGIAVYTPQRPAPASEPLREAANLPLISPLLACNNGKEILSDSASLKKRELKKVIDDARSVGNADDVSVYFRDMVTGNWLSVGGQEHYAPASLFKVPYMMLIYKLAEDEPTMRAQLAAGLNCGCIDAHVRQGALTPIEGNQMQRFFVPRAWRVNACHVAIAARLFIRPIKGVEGAFRLSRVAFDTFVE